VLRKFAIAHICFDNPDGQRLFSTPETVSAFNNALQKHATDAARVWSVFWAAKKICTDNPAGLKLFATNDFISALKNVEKYATTYASKTTLNGFCLKLLEDFLKQNPQQQDNNVVSWSMVIVVLIAAAVAIAYLPYKNKK
jgi:hypothetical protein